MSRHKFAYEDGSSRAVAAMKCSRLLVGNGIRYGMVKGEMRDDEMMMSMDIVDKATT